MRAGNKTELVNLELIPGEEISSDSLLMNTGILCHDCADKSETLVQKLLEVRESFESSRNAIAEEKGGINVNKMAHVHFRSCYQRAKDDIAILAK